MAGQHDVDARNYAPFQYFSNIFSVRKVSLL